MFEVKFRPSVGKEVEYKGLVCYDEFVWVDQKILERETAPPNMTALVADTIVKLCPKRGAGTSPMTLIFSVERFFIQKITL